MWCFKFFAHCMIYMYLISWSYPCLIHVLVLMSVRKDLILKKGIEPFYKDLGLSKGRNFKLILRGI